jgi:GT2 family glycosyltransferase
MPSASEEASWRVLVAPLVYNGEEFVEPCLRSLAAMDPAPHRADVLVLDDASPAPGWSERCAALASGLGLAYYRTPRNLGIPRNMNLALLYGLDAGYDAVVLLNSDTVVPENLVSTLVDPLVGDPTISSVTAWSNEVSIFSLPTAAPERLAARPDLVSWISERTAEEFKGETVPIPSGVGFCMALPVEAVRRVGLMDPVFGRGYSEEIDWCLRSHVEGFRSVLAPSCFVYHVGSGITKAEGMVGGGNPTVEAHQAIIDERYPLYRGQIAAFVASSIPAGMRERGLRSIILGAARERGYTLETSRLPSLPSDDEVRFVIDPEAEGGMIAASYEGFQTPFTVGEGGVLPTVTTIVGAPPRGIRIFAGGTEADRLVERAAAEQLPVLSRPAYRERVL